MSDDPRIIAAQHRGRQLVAARKRLDANLEQAIADDDVEAQADCIGGIAEIDAQGFALNQTVTNYVNANTPQRAVELTPEQLRVEPLTEWKHAAKIAGVTEDEYLKSYDEMTRAGWRPGSGQNGFRG